MNFCNIALEAVTTTVTKRTLPATPPTCMPLQCAYPTAYETILTMRQADSKGGPQEDPRVPFQGGCGRGQEGLQPAKAQRD